MLDLDDICLLLIHDAAEVPRHWMYQWEVGYPLVQAVTVDERECPSVWRQKLDEVMRNIDGELLAVAYRTGCNAFAHWLYHAGVNEQRRITGAILAAPLLTQWSDDPAAPENRARVNFRTALVYGNDAPQAERLQTIARHLGAKALMTPYGGDLNAHLGGWQWGMKLMQDILLD
ncbi:MAG: alpha/beta hydrolase [Neisseria sp.]|nr:alpha/beta hydrolase [Neisseria sp.]